VSTLSSHLGRAFLVEFGALLQLLIQLSFGSKLENEVDASLVVEIAIQAENVRVPDTANEGAFDQSSFTGKT
jgi:hypothetical protein